MSRQHQPSSGQIPQQRGGGRPWQAEAAHRPVRGFKTLKTAYATIKGFEVMHALRKGQAGAFNITRDICGEARLIERAFGLGASALSEAVQFVTERLRQQPA